MQPLYIIQWWEGVDGLGRKIVDINRNAFIFTLSASCSALEGRSTIGNVFQKHFWLGPPLVLGGQITTFVPKTGENGIF